MSCCQAVDNYNHSKVHHQGSLFTKGAIHSAGLWTVGGKRLINSALHRCVKCRRLGWVQKMVDLPPQHLSLSPPFTYMGLDVFSPWAVVTWCTKRGVGGMLLQKNHIHLTHKVLSTLMAEVSAIINARPLVPVSSDPCSPCILMPAMPLTQKSGAPVLIEDYTEEKPPEMSIATSVGLANEF